MAGKPWTEEQKAAARERRAAEEYSPPEIVEGEFGQPEPEIAEPEELDDFGRFRMTLDAETLDLLGDDELRAIWADQLAKAKAEKRAATKKAVASRAKHHALVVEGLLPQDVIADQVWRDRMAEQIRFTVDLPEVGDIGLRIDQKVYLHGHSYTVSRSEYESMRSTIYQAQQAELLFEGKDKRNWLRRRARGSLERNEDGAVVIG